MRAGLRLRTILLTGWVVLLPAPTLAQETLPATTNTPATDAIGPRELQNFSLPGTKTQPTAQAPTQPTAAAPPPVARAQPQATATKPPQPQSQPARRQASVRPTQTPVTAPAPAALPAQTQSTASAPTFGEPTLAPAAAMPATLPPPIAPDTSSGGGAIALPSGISFLPWLIAALALAGGAFFLLWQRRTRAAAAAGPAFDLLVAPEAASQPRVPKPSAVPQPTKAGSAPGAELPPVPQPPKVAPKANSGIVASRLRPSLEIGVQPLRCVVDDEQVAIEFEIELFNAGTAPARAVLAEASIFNPGATQDQELAAFFAKPVGAGNRLDAIPPMRRINLTSQVVAPRAAIQEYEVGVRKSFVPVIAFNALYEWSGGKGQTSAAYLVGRETGHDKLGPLRLDNGMREFRAVGARPLPTALRT